MTFWMLVFTLYQWCTPLFRLRTLCDGLLPGKCKHNCVSLTVIRLLTLLDEHHVRVSSALGSVPVWLEERANNSLCGCLSDCMNSSSSDRYPQIVDIIAACLDGFPLGEYF